MLLTDNGFNQNASETKFRYNYESDEVEQFIFRCIQQDSTAEPLPKDKLFLAYQQFCKDYGKTEMTADAFWKGIWQRPWIKECKPLLKNEKGEMVQVRCVSGCKLLSDLSDLSTTYWIKRENSNIGVMSEKRVNRSDMVATTGEESDKTQIGAMSEKRVDTSDC
jgi:hypothetical protein